MLGLGRAKRRRLERYSSWEFCDLCGESFFPHRKQESCDVWYQLRVSTRTNWMAYRMINKFVYFSFLEFLFDSQE